MKDNVITLRMTGSQANKLAQDAKEKKLSVNQYALLELGVDVLTCCDVGSVLRPTGPKINRRSSRCV